MTTHSQQKHQEAQRSQSNFSVKVMKEYTLDDYKRDVSVRELAEKEKADLEEQEL